MPLEKGVQAGGTARATCSEVPVYLAGPRARLEAGVLGSEQEQEQPEEGRAGIARAGSSASPRGFWRP